jgi:hypothetical protein
MSAIEAVGIVKIWVPIMRDNQARKDRSEGFSITYIVLMKPYPQQRFDVVEARRATMSAAT